MILLRLIGYWSLYQMRRPIVGLDKREMNERGKEERLKGGIGKKERR